MTSLVVQREGDDEAHFPGSGNRLGGSGSPRTEGAKAYFDRHLPAPRTPSARGSSIEDDLAQWRAAKDAYLSSPEGRAAAKRSTGRQLPEVIASSAAGTTLEEAVLARRAAMKAYLKTPEARAAATRGAQAETASIGHPADDVLSDSGEQHVAAEFDAAAAAELLSAHPPTESGDALSWIASLPEAELAGSGFTWERQDHLATMTDAFAKAVAASATQATSELERRRDRLVPANSDTWDLMPVAFFNGVSAGAITEAADGQAFLEGLQKKGMRANGKGSVRIACHLNTRHHTHLASGSWGVAFIYVVTDDYRVQPVVYDIARSRPKNGNMYKWWQGPTGYDSEAPVPPSHPLG